LTNGSKLAVAGHLAGCAQCSAMADELRLVESRLAGVAEIEPRADFTHMVMARVATMPAPRPAWHARIAWIGTYLIAAWLLLALAISTRALSWQGVFVQIGAFTGKLAAGAGALYHIGQHFHVATFAGVAFAVEIILIIVAAVVGRKYISRIGASLLGARL
jgi:hypothetical protein